MDYEVFMLSRMREAYDETGSTDEASELGLASTGKLVTSGALILICPPHRGDSPHARTHRTPGAARRGVPAGLLRPSRAVRQLTLKRSPEPSHTMGLGELAKGIMERNGVRVDVVRAVDHHIATGVYPDMTEHGWERDEWPAIFEQVMVADILVLLSPIWLGEKSSVCTKVIERLYGNSHLLNEAGQYAYYGRVGGCLITGNEDGAKHCAMNILYSLQHLGYAIPPQADAGWMGAAGPGPSYLDPGSGGPENDFTNRNTSFMAWNLMHLARILKDAGGIPAYGNQRSEWDAGCHPSAANPEHR